MKRKLLGILLTVALLCQTLGGMVYAEETAGEPAETEAVDLTAEDQAVQETAGFKVIDAVDKVIAAADQAAGDNAATVDAADAQGDTETPVEEAENQTPTDTEEADQKGNSEVPETGEAGEKVSDEGASDEKGAEKSDVVNTEITSGSDSESASEVKKPAMKAAVNAPAPQADSQYDTTKPVIEKIEFPQQGQTLKKGDVVNLYVYAYDADSGIKSVEARLNNNYPTFSYNESEKRYEATLTLGEVGTGKVELISLRVTDNSGNYADGDIRENYQYLYWFNTEGTDFCVKTFTLEQNGQTLDTGDAVSVILEAEPALDVREICVRMKNSADGMTTYFCVYRDGTGNRYTGELDSYFTDGPWTVTEVFVCSLGTELKLQADGLEQNGFQVKKTVSEDVKNDKIKPVITSVELEKNGEILRAGDRVTVTVKATDDVELAREGGLNFHAIEDIADSSAYVSLEYSEQDGAYHGTFTVDEDTYPCEWYINSLSIYDAAGNRADEPLNILSGWNASPYYVRVYNGNTFVNKTYDATISFRARNAEGTWTEISSQKVKTERRKSLKEAGVVFPEMGSSYPGLTQIGWEICRNINGEEYSENVTGDTQICSSYVIIEAKYDKNLVHLTYSYAGRDGERKAENRTQAVKSGTTYEAFLESLEEYRPDGMTEDAAFTGWEYSIYNTRSPIIVRDAAIGCTAKYTGKILLGIKMHYYDTEGRYYHPGREQALLVDPGIGKEEVITLLKEREMPKMYPGLKFKEWDIWVSGSFKNGDWVDMNAVYENCMVRYIVDPKVEEEDAEYGGYEYYRGQADDSQFETISCQVVENGAQIILPESLEGYSSVTWVEGYSREEWIEEPEKQSSYTAAEYMDFFGYGTKSGETPKDPDKPVTPDKPDTPGTPAKKLPEEELNTLVKQVEEAASGEVITVDMGDATVVPAELLAAAKGRNVTLKLQMDGYTWTINGKDILAANLKDVNMQVILDTDGIPGGTVRELAGDNPVRQLSLVHEGDFGFKATLTVNMGKEHAGLYGNLFYHDSDGRMVFIDAGQISGEGAVNLTFSHASDYLIVMSVKQMGPVGGGNSLKKNETKSVDTGDKTNAFPWLFSSFAALGVMALLAGKECKKRKW